MFKPLENRMIYLSGPMTGLPEHNRPAFASMAAALEAKGFSILNPGGLDNDDPGELPWEGYLCRDMQVFYELCGAVAVLPGWRDSRGAVLEIISAVGMGWPVVCALALAKGEYKEIAWQTAVTAFSIVQIRHRSCPPRSPGGFPLPCSCHPDAQPRVAIS